MCRGVGWASWILKERRPFCKGSIDTRIRIVCVTAHAPLVLQGVNSLLKARTVTVAGCAFAVKVNISVFLEEPQEQNLPRWGSSTRLGLSNPAT